MASAIRAAEGDSRNWAKIRETTIHLTVYRAQMTTQGNYNVPYRRPCLVCTRCMWFAGKAVWRAYYPVPGVIPEHSRAR